MINGVVKSDEGLVRLKIIGPRGKELDVTAVVDTASVSTLAGLDALHRSLFVAGRGQFVADRECAAKPLAKAFLGGRLCTNVKKPSFLNP